MNAPKQMQLMELRYQERSGLRDRNRYTIFYSRLCTADLAVFGINPGGDPGDPNKLKWASTTYYENWEHEYVDSRYRIQGVMLPFLKNVLATNNEGVRKIPKANLAFRRSKGEDSFEQYHGMTLTQAMHEAMPTICEILKFVSPKMIILEGMKDQKFRTLYCSGSTKQIRDPIWDKHRGKNVRVLEAANMYVNCLERELPIIALGHPSSFGKKPVWGSSVIPAVRKMIQQFGISVACG